MLNTFFQHADIRIVDTLELLLVCLIIVAAMGALLAMILLIGAIIFAPIIIAEVDSSPNLPTVVIVNLIAVASLLSSNTLIVLCGVISWIILLLVNILPRHKTET